MLECKRKMLIKLAAKAKSKESTLEFGERLQHFLDSNGKSYTDGLTFPIWCVKNGYERAIKMLAESGVELLNMEIEPGLIPLKIKKLNVYSIANVAAVLNPKMQKNLKKYVNKQRWQTTKLSEACINGDENEVRKLLNDGACVDGYNRELTTPLMFACQFGWVNIVKILIDAGANVNAKDFMHATPLMWASYGNNVEILKLLVENGADVNARDRVNKSTPLIWWATNSKDNVEGAKYLIKQGAKTSDIVYNEKKLSEMVLEGSGLGGQDWTAKDHAQTAQNYAVAEYLAKVRKAKNMTKAINDSGINV